MFLVAHFHNTIIGGVVFGYLAGITYWFPKVFGFTLHDKIGKYAAYAWQVGFLVAFMPLYALGLMGAVRRIDHYTDPSWQPFFITSAVGVLIIIMGTGLFVLQIVYSVWKRHELRDRTGDPWGGRTLEWSIPSPAPHYNFAVLPVVTHRDEWWYRKEHASQTVLEPGEIDDIVLPKNSGVGFILGMTAFVFGGALIWHIWWLALVAIVIAISLVIIRTFQEDTEYVLTKTEIARHEKEARV